jgi:hypothetical protein
MNHTDPEPEDDFKMARLPLRVRLREWWQEATGPLTQGHHLSMSKAVFARLLMWVPVAVVVLLLSGLAVVWLFTGWRAGDLAGKAMRNAEQGNFRLALLQTASAQSLRPRDERVLRARALVETLAGNPAAPSFWEAVPSGAVLFEHELRHKSVAMTRFGSDEQHEKILAELAQAGLGAEAAVRRAERRSAQRDLGRAIAYAREAQAEDDTPEHRLFLARLLAARHGPLLQDPRRTTAEDVAAMEEITQLVDSLVDTPLLHQALALGIRAPRLDPAKRVEWARVAFADKSATNPALLPAAYALRDFDDVTPEQLRSRLTLPFLHAPLPAQAAFADFLHASGLPEAALEVVSEAEAKQDAAAFEVRARALAATGAWEEMLALVETVGPVPEALRQITRAEAARPLGRRGVTDKSVRLAVRAAVREGSLPLVLERADTLGERAAADSALIELCGDAGQADYVFAVARTRFGARGQFESSQAAYERARAAAPEGLTVRDHRRYLDLIEGRKVDPAETAAALAFAPTDLGHRMTHALALWRSGQPREAWAVFDDFTVFYDELPPGYQAVICAIVAAQGDEALAERAAQVIDIERLSPGEYLLIGKWRVLER